MTIVDTLRRISDVEVDGADPVGWRDPKSSFILVCGDRIEAANALAEKRRLLGEAERNPAATLLLAWVGRYRTDVFVVDDRARAYTGLNPR